MIREPKPETPQCEHPRQRLKTHCKRLQYERSKTEMTASVQGNKSKHTVRGYNMNDLKQR